jgi:hypothetical protein
MSHDSPDRHAPGDGAGGDTAELERLLRQVVACARVVAEADDAARRGAPEAPVRAALATACARARADGLRAEHVLVRLKHVWAHTAEAPRAVPDATPGAGDAPRRPTRSADGGDDHHRLARVVTLCIEEFYEVDRARQGAYADPPRRAEEGRPA